VGAGLAAAQSWVLQVIWQQLQQQHWRQARAQVGDRAAVCPATRLPQETAQQLLLLLCAQEVGLEVAWGQAQPPLVLPGGNLQHIPHCCRLGTNPVLLVLLLLLLVVGRCLHPTASCCCIQL
jgi:hypothetical protein